MGGTIDSEQDDKGGREGWPWRMGSVYARLPSSCVEVSSSENSGWRWAIFWWKTMSQNPWEQVIIEGGSCQTEGRNCHSPYSDICWSHAESPGPKFLPPNAKSATWPPTYHVPLILLVYSYVVEQSLIPLRHQGQSTTAPLHTSYSYSPDHI